MMPIFRGQPVLVSDNAIGVVFPIGFPGRGPPLRVLIPPTSHMDQYTAMKIKSAPAGSGKSSWDENDADADDDDGDDDDDDLVGDDDEVEDWDLGTENDTSSARKVTRVAAKEASGTAKVGNSSLSPPPTKKSNRVNHPAHGKFRPAFEAPDDIEIVDSGSSGSEDSDDDDNSVDGSSGEGIHDWLDNEVMPPDKPVPQEKSATASRSTSAKQMSSTSSPLAKPSSAQALGAHPAAMPAARPHLANAFPPGFAPIMIAGNGPQPPPHFPPGAQIRLSPARSPLAAGQIVAQSLQVSPTKQPSYRGSIVGNVAPSVVPLSMVGSISPVKVAGGPVVSPPSPSPGVSQTAAIRDTKIVKKKKAELPQHNLPHPVPKFGDWLNSRTMINNYIILEALGAGSYAEVKLCKEKQSGKLFAMKFISRDIMKKDKLGKQSKLDDIKREIAIMKKLHHPNVLRLYEVMDDPKMNKLFLVLEYMKNGDLLTHQKKKHPHGALESFLDRDLHCIFLQVILGLAYLHEQKIVHGDIKPQNLLVGDKDVVKIADFGISQSLYGSKQKLLDMAGTPAFMSPEMCSGEEYSGQLADIWAVGATFFMLKFGQPPFVAKSAMQIFDKIQNDPLVFPTPIDPSLKHLLTGMLTKNPLERMTLLEVMMHPWVTMDENPSPSSLQSPVPLISVSKEEIDRAVGGQERFALIVNTRAQMMKRLHQARIEVLERHRRQQTSTLTPNTATGVEINSSSLPSAFSGIVTDAVLHQRSTPAKISGRPKGNKILASGGHESSESGRQMLTSEEIHYRSQLFSRKKPSNSKNTVEQAKASGVSDNTFIHFDQGAESDGDENFSSDDDDIAVSQSPQLLDELLLTTLSMPPLSKTSSSKVHGQHSNSCHEYTFSNNSSLMILGQSSDEQAYHSENAALGIHFGVSSLQGRRNTQEDRWVVVPALAEECEDVAYVGLYDGHGGEECANILHDQLHSWVFKDFKENGERMGEALESCFLELDSFVCDYLLQKGDLSGSTATSIVMMRSSDQRGVSMTVAHVGDCRLVLVRRNGEVVNITSDHRLDCAPERERIIKSGGRVVNNRVNGVMAITRAFGDLEFKGLLGPRGNDSSASSMGIAPILQQQQNPFAKDEEKTPALLTARPDVHSVALDPATDECLVLACDGLWDVLTSEEAAEIVRERLKLHGSVQLAAKELAQEAIRRYSNDNITVLLASLAAP